MGKQSRWADGTIDHEYTDEIVCPYCGATFDDSYEYFGDSECSDGIECYDCGKTFNASRSVTVKYSTKPIEARP